MKQVLHHEIKRAHASATADLSADSDKVTAAEARGSVSHLNDGLLNDSDAPLALGQCSFVRPNPNGKGAQDTSGGPTIFNCLFFRTNCNEFSTVC